MPAPITALRTDDCAGFEQACAFEHMFGSRALTALRAYGLDSPRARFFLSRSGGAPTAALYLSQAVLAVAARPDCDPAPIAEFIRREGVTEVDTHWALCHALQTLVGGSTESSYYMVYRGGAPEVDCSGMVPGSLPAVFQVLQQSHPYYQAHLMYKPWAEDLQLKLDCGLAELYQLNVDGLPVGTGCIASQDAECGVLAAVAVIPAYRHRGFGTHISRFLTSRILSLGRTPRLISGYDEVAQLYRQVGFEPCGRWGELYL